MSEYKLVKFGAPWCGMCRVMDKNLEGFKACEVIKYDVEDDENESVVEKYKVKNLPTMILIDGEGNPVEKWHGVVNAKVIEDKISSL